MSDRRTQPPGFDLPFLGHLRSTAAAGAKLIVFPECVLAGYGFGSRAEIRVHTEPYPGPSTAIVAEVCAALGVWCVYGFFEITGDKLYNSGALVGPSGPMGWYRKLHLPKVGADRITDPGDRPLEVFELGGLKIGMLICFDSSFPELTRLLALAGADVALLPTNWPDKAMKSATMDPPTRVFENHIFSSPATASGTNRASTTSATARSAPRLGMCSHPHRTTAMRSCSRMSTLPSPATNSS